MKMCQALGTAGHDTTLYATYPKKIEPDQPQDPFIYYGVERTFSINYTTLSTHPGGSYYYAFVSAYKALRSKPTLVYGRNPLGCLFSALRGYPTALELHMPNEQGRPLVAFALGLLFRLPAFKALIVITDTLRKHYESAWPFLKDHIIVAPDGADPIDPNLEPVSLTFKGERPQIAYVGHLYHGKGAELVAEVAELVPEFDFHIVGGTECDLERWRRDKNLPSNLKLHGYIPHKDVPTYLLAFDTLLLPNQPCVHIGGGSTDIGEWTSPLKLFEYMASGRPIICSDVPVLQDIAHHNVNMLVCRHDRAEDWAEALRYLADHPEVGSRLAAEAQSELINVYSWQARARTLIMKIAHNFQSSPLAKAEG